MELSSELKYFYFFLWRSSLKTLEDKDTAIFNEVKLDEKEGRRLDSVFEAEEESFGRINSGGGSSFVLYPNIE